MASLPPPVVPVRETMQVRFFHDRNLEALERAINQWLAERPNREIVEIRQSVATDPAGRGGDREVLVSIWYIED